MVRQSVRNLHSQKKIPPRFCDVLIDGDQVFLEKETDKHGIELIPWDDVVSQVTAAKATAKNQKLPQVAR